VPSALQSRRLAFPTKEDAMPLVRITVAEGLTPETRRAIADAVHEALVETAGVPADGRFQVIEEVPAENWIWDPGYLGIPRTGRVVLVQIFLNHGRSVEVKRTLFGGIAQRLVSRAGIQADDVIVNLVEVPRENWSFGRGMMSYPPTAGS
jgi:4-oxalocrotonate tautomerase